jgi:hypothetical protein
MKWIVFLILMTTYPFFPLYNADAQVPGKVDNTASPDSKSGAGAIETAIDAAELWDKGLSDADIATQLSAQRGLDRQAALNKGVTDEKIIDDLITSEGNTPTTTDTAKSFQFRTAGDKAFKESRYAQAAKEYTRAIEYSRNSYELYILRANTYKQYLATTVNPAIQNNSDKAKQVPLDKSRTLLCRALYSDCERVKQISRKKIEDIQAEINAIRGRMAADTTESDTSYAVNPYYQKSAQKTHLARQLRKLNQDLKNANQVSVNMMKALPDYKPVCEMKGAAAE